MNASQYLVVEVADSALPDEHDWMLIDEDDQVIFVIKRGAWSAEAVADGWAAYRKVMRNRETPTRPVFALRTAV